jgi:hypothetical protein
MSPLPLIMSAELQAGDAKVVVLASSLSEHDILPTLGSAVDFLSRLKENLTLPPGQEWTISFAADQTSRLQCFSGRTIGQPKLESSDTQIGASSEASPVQSEIAFPKVG